MTMPLKIVVPLHAGVTQLASAGPDPFSVPLADAEVTVASLGGAQFGADDLALASVVRLEILDRCHILCVLGGACPIAVEDASVAGVLRLGTRAEYITPVCNGSLLLGAAGLIERRRAACHSAWREMLQLFVTILDEARVVHDGNVIIGGGATAEIEFASAPIAGSRRTPSPDRSSSTSITHPRLRSATAARIPHRLRSSKRCRNSERR